MAEDVSGQRKKGFQEGWGEGWQERTFTTDTNQWQRLYHNSFFNWDNISAAFDKESGYTLGGRAGHLTAAFLKDVTTDGTRLIWWALNHPLAVTSFLSEGASRAAGLTPDIARLEKEFEGIHERPGNREDLLQLNAEQMGWYHDANRRGPPQLLAQKLIPLMTSAAVLQTSGNHDLLNVLNGGRPPGFTAVFPTEGDKTVSESVPAELAARYVLGRRGRLLPWEQFTEERPDIGPVDYQNYKQHQNKRGFLGVGKVTGRNLEGEPEAELMGFRVPFSSATTAGGTMLGGIAGSKLADRRASAMAAQGKTPKMAVGPRRMAGAAIGGTIGMLAGNLGGKALNALAIQPIVAPEQQQQQRAWLEQQRQAGNL